MADAWIERRRHPTPSRERLQRCKLISHRGDHGHNPLEENSIAAFDRAAKAGVWGLELDIRFTADGEPVVFHDACFLRVYGHPQPVAGLSFDEIRRHYPNIPALADVVRRFGQQLHLMIEVKQQSWPQPSRQNGRLRDILSALEPARDFHLLGLHPRVLTPVQGIPSYAMVAISEYCPELRSHWVRRRPWGGVCGHFLLLRRGVIRGLHKKGQKAGTGYVRSRNGLFREINRGVDWIFSDNAVQLQTSVNAFLPDM